MNNDSESRIGEDYTTFAAEDAVSLYRAKALASNLLLLRQVAARGQIGAWTPTAMLAAASKITGRTYKRGQCELAAADLKRWADDMAAALPITRATGRKW